MRSLMVLLALAHPPDACCYAVMNGAGRGIEHEFAVTKNVFERLAEAWQHLIAKAYRRCLRALHWLLAAGDVSCGY